MVQISPEIKGGKIIPLVTGNRGKNLKPNGTILALLKPHYEAEKHMLMGGKLKPEFVEQVVAKVMNEVSEIMESVKSSVQTYKVMGPIESPIVGDKAKNKEFLFGINLQD